MTNQNARARHRKFLSNGFYPPELPPIFQSTKFGKFRNFLVATYDKLPPIKGLPNYYYYKSDRHSFWFPRFSKEDRVHSIINPVNYFFISKLLSGKWVSIQSHLKKARYSISKPVFDWSGERVFLPPSFDARDYSSSHMSAVFNYLCHTDITRFYHSIYTHSVPWALHTKKSAKRNKSHSLWGNTLDTLVRNAQDGQTVGIPVGPDTSRVIGEIIGSAIDQALDKSLKANPGQAARFVDDYAIGCETKEQAEKALVCLRKAINDFELDINFSKTTIHEAKPSAFSGWRHEVTRLVPRANITKSDLELFFFKLRDIAKDETESNVISYGIKKARSAFLKSAEWPFIEDFLLSSYKDNPTILPSVCRILIMRNSVSADLRPATIRQFIKSTVVRLLQNRKFGELSWILFLAMNLGVELEAKYVRPAFVEPDALLATMLSDINERKLLAGTISTKVWDTYKNSDGLKSPMWLYAYEANLRNWGSATPTDFVTADDYFGPMKTKKIHFYGEYTALEDLDETIKKEILLYKKAKRVATDFEEDFEIDLEEIELIEDDNDFY